MVQMKGCKGSQIMYLSVAFVLFFFLFFFLKKNCAFLSIFILYYEVEVSRWCLLLIDLL